MDTPMPNIMFRGMTTIFKIRDWLKPRHSILHHVGIRPGDKVLDFGCGPGGYVPAASKLVGETGLVFALDLHPLAIQSVKTLARKQNLRNVKTIQSNGPTGLPTDSVDVVLLYDSFHMLSQPNAVLTELHRVLKAEGILSVIEPHWDQERTIADISQGARFQLIKKEARILSFVPQSQSSGKER